MPRSGISQATNNGLTKLESCGKAEIVIGWRRSKRHMGNTGCNYDWEVKRMLKWAVVFLIIAIVAAVLGFGVLAGAAATIAEILFVVFLIFLIISFIFGWRGRPGA